MNGYKAKFIRLFMGLKIPKISSLLAEETGWHIGDGSMNYYRNRSGIQGFYQLRGHINDDRDHYINYIKQAYQELYGIDISLRTMPSTGVFGFQKWGDNLLEFKRKLGLPLGKKWAVFIPPLFLKNNFLIVAVIRGIFDTDGCVYIEDKRGRPYPRLEMKTLSEKLAHQLFVLLNALGLRTTQYLQRAYPESGVPNPEWVIVIRGHDTVQKFFDVIKPKNRKHIDKYQYYIISALFCQENSKKAFKSS